MPGSASMRRSTASVPNRQKDMANLMRTDIAWDTMYITTQKSHDRLPINLNSFAREILA